ncbi:MAG: hypothetical protein A2W99_06320 [Bacteroidetes bacterium GWF2_33_16]|nr:MAG: hypothetical protein A2X00_12575 [Bacteroidetes bacterium GWE2_32_14]OFY05294.1 MAG: hypothetical protein A2W99_06320 [Bacteroidetes bacterium GWF2_33_16]
MDKRLEREKRLINLMVKRFCDDKHNQNALCLDCSDLLEYAHNRLLACPFAEDKPVCSKCTIHCYNTNYRKQIIEVMRYSGPKMLFKNPIDTFLYFWDKYKHRNLQIK